MERDLLEIQETVIKYAEVISQVIGIDVEVVDNMLFRVAGTGIYEDGINSDMSKEGYVYRHVLNTGERKTIYNPGKEELCIGCPKHNNCKETFEISTPIKLKDEIIGVIGIVGSNMEQKRILIEKLHIYLSLVDQISDFIATKAAERREGMQIRSMLSALNTVINHTDQGVLILGKDSILESFNENAKKQLEISENALHKKVEIKSTGDKIDNLTEYTIEIEGKTFTVMAKLKSLKDTSAKYGKILIFQNINQYHSRMYEMITPINRLEAGNIVGSSKETLELKRNIHRIAHSSSTVLITGESGTGKEMVATAVWKESDRRDKQFVAVNCGAIPENLLESELFGYVKGAFTGADPKGRVGKFELANNGIIFLDEIGDMPIYLQVKILRVLQERNISRIGSNQVIPLNVRVIAATNKNLKKMIEEKKFREDLYYRLNVIPLNIEPLRNRKDDIDELVVLFIERYSSLFDKKFVAISEDVMDRLKEYKWFGNVRELENVVEFMVNMMGQDGILNINTLPSQLLEKEYISSNENPDDIVTIEQLEISAIAKALKKFGKTTTGKKQASKALGIGIATLYRKLEKYGLE